MFDRATLDKLIEHAPLAVTVMGVVVFLAAAAGGLPVGNPPIAVGSPAWRVLLALLGTGLAAAGILLMWQGSGTSPPGQEDLAHAARYGIRIDSPRAMSQISYPELTVTGSYALKPPEGALRLFTLTTPEGRFVQPQTIVETFDEERQQWSGRVQLADPPRYSVFIVAALVGETGEKLWDYYFKVAGSGASYPLDGPLPPDIVECQRIWVERVSGQA